MQWLLRQIKPPDHSGIAGSLANTPKKVHPFSNPFSAVSRMECIQGDKVFQTFHVPIIALVVHKGPDDPLQVAGTSGPSQFRL